MELILYNGEMIKRSEAKINIEDRGFQFGDGVYEVIRIYNGQPFALEPHLDRLYESAKKIYLEIPYSKSELKNLISSFIDLEKVNVCNFYLQISRGASVRNHLLPEKSTPTLIGYFLEGPRPINLMEKGGKVVLAEDTRWFHCDIKSISLLGNVMARHKATMAGGFEGILHRGPIITEATAANVWIGKNGKLYTHPPSNLILNGITRQILLQLCQKHGIPVEEKAFTVEELFQADEVFLTSTTLEVVPVIKVDDAVIGTGTPGPLTRNLQQLYEKKVMEECGALVKGHTGQIR